MPREGSNPAKVQQVAESLWALVDAESGPDGKKKARALLKRFLTDHGRKMIHEVTPADLIAFKAKLVADGLAPSSINDLLCYARRLLNHAFDIEAIGEQFRLKILKNVPRLPLTDKAASIRDLSELLRLVAGENRNLARVMLLQFYGVMRPSEVPRVIHGEGQPDGRGVIKIHSKTTRRTGELRPVLLTDPALDLIESIQKFHGKVKMYPNGTSYRHMCWKIGERLKQKLPEAASLIRALTGRESLCPHRLRHAANQALIDAEVSEEHRRVAMGRLLPRVERTYGVRANCQAARKAIAVLADLIPPTVIEVARKTT